uniref:ATP-dependent DNA helicase n=1 Tax=Nicotiana sylvestris TaxID=4096 RepID=A0A1U7VW82_NICSY
LGVAGRARFIALATTTSGVAASILPGGRTAHSRFKIPIDIDENFSCNINKQSSLACLIRDVKLIVWDEVSMAKKKMIKTHVISAKIASGDFKNTHVFIPRIPLMSSEDEKSPVQFKRTQFSVRLCFAMTINKSQGQTLDFVDIYLREPVFSHDHLYVALSREKASNCLKILIQTPNLDSDDDHSTYNIVYDEIIQKAFL